MKFDKISADYVRNPVPIEGQKNWISLAAVWGATFLCIPVLALAFEIAPKLSLNTFILYAF